MDKSSLAGIFIALGGILFGLFLEGGKMAQILQPTAAMIVFGIAAHRGQQGGAFAIFSITCGSAGLLATALFDRPAFRSCVAHGIVLVSNGTRTLPS